jgi:ERCC4-type nuclease
LKNDDEGVKMTVDTHEPDYIVALLVQLGIDVERKMITPGDYVLSSDCAVERKTVQDFINSMFSGRLFEQAEALKEAYAKPLLILEGDIELELEQRKNPRAFWGALLGLQVNMGVPIISTPTFLHTADVLYILAKRLQRKKAGKIAVQHKPRLMSDRDWQIYVVAGLPSIGNELATRLLRHFKSVRRVFQAVESDLEKVEGIGNAKAKRIHRLLDMQYNKGE